MQIKVNSITCEKCASKIQLGLLNRKIIATVNATNKMVTLQNKDDYDKAVQVIEALGYKI